MKYLLKFTAGGVESFYRNGVNDPTSSSFTRNRSEAQQFEGNKDALLSALRHLIFIVSFQEPFTVVVEPAEQLPVLPPTKPDDADYWSLEEIMRNAG